MNHASSKNIGCLVVGIIFLILLLILVMVVVFVRSAEKIGNPSPSPGVSEQKLEQEQSEEETISYIGESIPVKQEVEKNTFSASDFTLLENGDIQYTGGYSAKGIDVSSHQGDIDWELVKGDGVEFAIIRMGYRGYGEGTLNEDEKFRQNMEGALSVGIKVGIYFYSQAISTAEAVEEANFVMDAIREYDITYPVVFDWETIEVEDARTNGMGRDQITACAIAFCDTISAAGYEPCVYFNSVLGYLAYDLSLINGNSFWLAEYDPYPEFYYDFHIWQYSCTGKINGIDAEVDLNLSFKEYSEVLSSNE